MSSSIEQEIAEIEQNLAAKRAEFKQQREAGEAGEMPHEKEILREVVGEKIAPPAGGADSAQSDNLQRTIIPPLASPPQAHTPSYLSEELKGKVQELVDLAFSKSLDEAVKAARATANGALIDAFHDALTDELFTHLVERQKLKKF